jgi:hypothetical protein
MTGDASDGDAGQLMQHGQVVRSSAEHIDGDRFAEAAKKALDFFPLSAVARHSM